MNGRITNMSTVVNSNFAVKPLVAAVALAFSAVSAYAAPTLNQMPGAGRVTHVSTGTTVNGTGVGTDFTGLTSPGSFTLSGAANPRAVIQWGGVAGLTDVVNPAGFNIGQNAEVQFRNTGGGLGAVLNIDASGNASQIFGRLRNDFTWGAVAMFVANANGITVGSSAVITAPYGVGLIAADLNNSTAKYDFVRNNSAATSYIDVKSGHAPLVINGYVSGDEVANVPAQYVLLVGSNVTNAGNIYGADVLVVAGMAAATQKTTVNAVANTEVNRLFNTDSTFLAINGDLGTQAGNVSVASASGSFVNSGSLAASDWYWGRGIVDVYAASTIRSGTSGSTDVQVGVFADAGIYLATYSATGKTELYNVVSGYSTNKTLPELIINDVIGAAGDVTISTLTPGTQPSSIYTTGDVWIKGGNVVINSTINHKLGTSSVPAGGDDLYIRGTKSVTITADVGAETDVEIRSSGPMTISGNVTSDTNDGGAGLVYIWNDGQQSGNTTTISGNVSVGDVSKNSPTSFSGTGENITIENLGATSSNLVITGTVTPGRDGGDAYIRSNGNLQLAKVDADGYYGGNYVDIWVNGTTSKLQGSITASEEVEYTATRANTTLTPAAVITAPDVYLDVLNFKGVGASGTGYADASEKPAAQIVANYVDVYARGSVNAPITGNTDWLKNAMAIEAYDPTQPIWADVSAVGGGFQAINLQFIGNAMVSSGDTYTPFQDVGFTTGTAPSGGLVPNGGSQLILHATGNLDIYNGWISPYFEFPGGVVFKAGEALTVNVPVYNAWTLEALPYQGVFFEAPVINQLGYVATNGNSWGNWSVQPSAGTPTVYQIRQPLPTTLQFVTNPSAVVQNTYSELILGAPVNTCPASVCGWTP